MEKKEAVFGQPAALRLKGTPLMQAVALKQAQELKEGRIISLIEVVKRAVDELYKREIVGKEVNALYRSEIGEKEATR